MNNSNFKIKPLIDGDILCYEIGFGCYCGWDKGQGEHPPYDYVQGLLIDRIERITSSVHATEPCCIYLTENSVPTFRHKEATTKPYKGNRKQPKPFHFKNIFSNLSNGRWDFKIAKGIEADDLMSLDQVENNNNPDKTMNTVICSRDKDLRQVPGFHYSWEVGKQAEQPLRWVSQLGFLEKNKNKYSGGGFLFFCFQLLIGDSVDNIPGLKGYGPAKAYKLLNKCFTEKQALETVVKHYKKVMKKDALPYLLEQLQLVWIMQGEDKWNEIIKTVKEIYGNE